MQQGATSWMAGDTMARIIIMARDLAPGTAHTSKLEFSFSIKSKTKERRKKTTSGVLPVSNPLNPFDRHSYFFDNGIRFACKRCGNCCTGAPGIVRVNRREIAHIAALLKIPEAHFIRTYLTPWQGGHSIREDQDGTCLFFRNGCQVYPVRPHQCRQFPFWFVNLRSEARWQTIRRQCPGVGHGRLYSKTEILALINASA